MKDLQYLSMVKEVAELHRRNHPYAYELLKYILLARGKAVAAQQKIGQAAAEKLVAPDIAARTGISVDTILAQSIPF